MYDLYMASKLLNLLSQLPIVLFFSITTFATNVTTLLRSGLIAIFAFILISIKPINLKKYKFETTLFSIITICFTISFILNDQNYSNFLIGTYGRNMGILALIGLFILTLGSAEYFSSQSKKLISSLYILLLLSIIYGFVQALNIDPINWETGAGLGSTIGNPNFFGALLGVLSIIPLFYFIESRDSYKYLHLVAYLLVFILTFIIGGSQGYIVFIFSLLLFSLIRFKDVISRKFRLVLFSLLALITSFTFILFANVMNITTTIDDSLQFKHRLEHWALSARIFRDHIFFGVGIENLTNFSGEYRNMAIRNWGIYTLPDKSHNLFIDFFVTGGLFVGICWILFVFFVFYKAVYLIKNISRVKESWHTYIFLIVWTSWILQTIFSPSHLILEVCGMMSGGALIGLANKAKIENKVYAK